MLTELETPNGVEYLDENGETVLEVSFEDDSDYGEDIILRDVTIWRPGQPSSVTYGDVLLMAPAGTPEHSTRLVLALGKTLGHIDCDQMMRSLAELLEKASVYGIGDKARPCSTQS